MSPDGGLFNSTDGGVTWKETDNGLPSGDNIGIGPIVIDAASPTTLYVAAGGVFKSTDGGTTWRSVDNGLNNNAVQGLAIDPAAPGTLYAATGAGVFDIEQVSICVGDCSGAGTVAITDLITLVNIALGTAQASACPHGVPGGAEVNIALIIQAVGNALNGCGAG